MKKIFISVLVAHTVFLAGSIVDAQMIDYSRRNKYRKSEQAEAKKVQGAGSDETNHNETSSKSDSLFTSLPEIKSRAERVYDQNNDGLLQEEELRKLFADVVRSVEQWGQISVNSDMLRPYDEDENGQISFQEVQTIKDLLE
jgi:hypothetical protein